MSTLRAVVKQRVGSDELRNVFYVAGGYAIMDNIQAIADYFRAAWVEGGSNEKMVNQMSSGWELYGMDFKDVTDEENPVVPVNFTAGALGGSDASERLPLQTCLLVTFQSLTAPPNRSRKYLGGFTEPTHNSSGWVLSTKNAVDNWAGYLLNMATGLDTGIALVVSRINAGVLIGSNILDSHVYVPYARTQRRRTPGRGI